MKIAVVGAGIFGVTIALGLDAVGHEVVLFDEQKDILTSTSRANQYRLHMGYHYPRSLSTMKSCLEGLKSFEEAYKGAIFDDVEQIYCVAKSGSKTDPEAYLNILDSQGLEYKVRNDLKHIKYDNISLAIEVPEKMFSYFTLKGICLEKLARSRVQLRLNTKFMLEMVRDFDQAIVATYTNNNDFCDNPRQYQFKLVEKLILHIPDIQANLGTVIIDGNFCCLDPFPNMSGLFLMGHVEHAIHSRNVGTCPSMPTMPQDVFGYYKLLNKGIISAGELYGKTKAPFIIGAGRQFFNYSNPIHVGSMFTYRVVLPDTDETDERLSIVERVSDKVITVLGGKIPTAVSTAQEVVEKLQK